jgi:formylglycine-generating enzyme required for sulfatase activity
MGRRMSCMSLFVTLLLLAAIPAGCGSGEQKGTPANAPAAPADSSSKTADSLTVDLGGGVKMELVLIRPGSFMMGSEGGNFADEKPVHKVTITKPFYIGKCEVTQGEWQAVMGTNPSSFKGEKNPVETVSWNDCQTFIAKLNEKVAQGAFRLPTEAEWEYACRAGSSTAFCYGDDEKQLGDYAWYSGNRSETTHPVGKKKPNAWGLYDMHGNVWEWCQDWYGSGYYSDGPDSDPQGPSSGLTRVLRGGSWSYDPVSCRSAGRGYFDPTVRDYYYYGVRVVRGL